jgi:hypothetical protein
MVEFRHTPSADGRNSVASDSAGGLRPKPRNPRIKGRPWQPQKNRSKKAPAKKSPTRKAAPQDAIALLRADHKLVSDLFEQFEKTRSDARKAAIVAQICKELTVHTEIEEEIFYPAVKAALKDHELIPEANVEHASVKDLIAQVEGKTPTAKCMTPA